MRTSITPIKSRITLTSLPGNGLRLLLVSSQRSGLRQLNVDGHIGHHQHPVAVETLGFLLHQ